MLNAKVSKEQRIENSITLLAKKVDEHLNLCRSTPEEQAHVSENVMQHEASCTLDALTPINAISVDSKTSQCPSDTVHKPPAPIETHTKRCRDLTR